MTYGSRYHSYIEVVSGLRDFSNMFREAGICLFQ